MRRCLLLLQVKLVTLAFMGDSYSQSASVVDIGNGRKVYLECEGSGIPVVLLVSGKGNRADTWRTNRREPGNPEASVFSRLLASLVCALTTVPGPSASRTSRAAAIQCQNR